MKILGLDLGVGSIGWALIETDSDKMPQQIIAAGSRIVSLTPDDLNNFNKGNGETVNHQRTMRRTARKGMNRYQDRRKQLLDELSAQGMIDPRNRMLTLSPYELWELRAKAATPGCRLTLCELGRVLMHLDQRRGYRHAKSDSSDAKQTEYVEAVNRRHKEMLDLGMTAGQYFFTKLKESEQVTPKGKVYTYRIKNQVLPRQAYQEEFDAIMQVQSEFYPEVLTANTVSRLKNTIFYQRPLKSCKHLVSRCDFIKITATTPEGKTINASPKVTAKTSPLEQVCRIYEAINNIRLYNYSNKSSNIAQQFAPKI